MQNAAASEQIAVLLNGEQRRIPAGQNIVELLAWLELPADRVAVELNRALVRKRDWEQTRVDSDASIEIVEFVGGG